MHVHKWGGIDAIENLMLMDRDIYLSLLEAEINANSATPSAPAELTPDEIARIKSTGARNKAKMNGNS
jgi:hypothetical protein